MPKKIINQKLSWIKTTNNPWVISLLLATVGLSLILSTSALAGWLDNSQELLASSSSQYMLQEDYWQQADNEGNLTTKTAISPASLRGPIISSSDPSLGTSQAMVNIVYYSDFACSFCREQEAILRQAVEKYGDQVRLIRKDLPDNNPSSLSYQAAKAGRCAWQQNSFWPFHDQLLSNNSLKKQDLERAASSAGLDVAAFNQCLKNHNDADILINNNWQEADALGISGTPYIYVNQRDFLGQISWPDLQTTIEAEIASKSSK